MTLLCGFQGCGKSTVGKALSVRWNCPFVDTDQEIERINGRSVRELYSEYGERRFRQLERSVVEQLPTEEKQVIALGGGTLLDIHNRERLLQYQPIIYLELPLSLLRERWEGQAAFAPTRERERSAFADRVEVYQTVAAITLPVAGLSVEEVIEEIVRLHGE